MALNKKKLLFWWNKNFLIFIFKEIMIKFNYINGWVRLQLSKMLKPGSKLDKISKIAKTRVPEQDF